MEKARKQKAVQQCKVDFAKSQELVARKKLQMEKEKRTEREDLERSRQEWESENKAAQLKVKNQHEEDHAIREAHIAEAAKLRDADKRATQEYEQMLLQHAKEEMEMERAKAEARRQQEFKHMESIKAENIRERERKKQQELIAAEEKFRLMQEDIERTKQEEARRQAALEERIKRYEIIGEFWNNAGAGKKQREEELRAERLTLEQAARKEVASAQREADEAEQRRARLIQVTQENALQQEQRKIAKKLQDEEDQQFAEAYVAEAEEYQKHQGLQKRQKQIEAKKYQEQLEKQV